MKRTLWRILRWLGVLLLLTFLALVVRGTYAFRDRSPGYSLDLSIDDARSRANPKPLRVGFGRVKINPDLSDPKRPVWLAGFSQHRAATGIHDDLWAVASVLDDGYTRVGLVALDAIGFFHDDVVAVRGACAREWKLDYCIVCSLHNHSTPDLMGLWGPNPLRTGVDPRYRGLVIAGAAEALGKAVAALEPARLEVREIPTLPDGLVADTRKPLVFDSDLRVMHFSSVHSGTTLGTIIGWGNHPETPWGGNTEITADFCGALRDTLERGCSCRDRHLSPLGGTHLFVNGAVGGLMTTHPSVTVHDPCLQQDFKLPSHDKSRAVGHQLASRILSSLTVSNESGATASAPIAVRARTIEVPIQNNLFLAAAYLGLMDRGHVRWKTLRSEVALLTIGDASIACVPGEIYPEIVNGGIEHPSGADLDTAPVEVPPLRQLMPGKVKFVFGLANDELGYLIPKSEWDAKPPHIYGETRGVYGEVNSCGPDAGVVVYRALADLCRSR